VSGERPARPTVFAKGNLDVQGALHHFNVGGSVAWNGINQAMREAGLAARAVVRHEVFTRSDALLAAAGIVPADLAERDLPLGPFGVVAQFSRAMFAAAGAVVLSIQPDLMVPLVAHRRHGYVFHPYQPQHWRAADRAWLRAECVPVGTLDAAASMGNFRQIVARIREQADVPILVMNVSAALVGPITHCYLGAGDGAEGFAWRVRRFNLALMELSAETGLSIIDVDAVVAQAGAAAVKLDTVHLTAAGHGLVAAETVRVLTECGWLDRG
jgi:hypothetical protein